MVRKGLRSANGVTHRWTDQLTGKIGGVDWLNHLFPSNIHYLGALSHLLSQGGPLFGVSARTHISQPASAYDAMCVKLDTGQSPHVSRETRSPHPPIPRATHPGGGGGVRRRGRTPLAKNQVQELDPCQSSHSQFYHQSANPSSSRAPAGVSPIRRQSRTPRLPSCSFRASLTRMRRCLPVQSQHQQKRCRFGFDQPIRTSLPNLPGPSRAWMVPDWAPLKTGTDSERLQRARGSRFQDPAGSPHSRNRAW